MESKMIHHDLSAVNSTKEVPAGTHLLRFGIDDHVRILCKNQYIDYTFNN